jgi:PilZ domain
MNARITIRPRKENPKIAEVRCAVRFPLTLPIRVITDNGEYEATTENISASGVLFSSS